MGTMEEMEDGGGDGVYRDGVSAVEPVVLDRDDYACGYHEGAD